MELYAIVSNNGLEEQLLWAGMAEEETAEDLAVRYAVSCGNVNLLSGRDLGWHLLGERPQRLSPTHPLALNWKPGERVELCQGGYGGNPRTYRPGTVERIDRKYGYHESLVVAFDDGETRPINPDVMRHIKED